MSVGNIDVVSVTTRNRDNIDIPDTYIHAHATMNRDNIDIPDTYIHDH
jgi:hypothetical protein